jgi:hypothetical protein
MSAKKVLMSMVITLALASLGCASDDYYGGRGRYYRYQNGYYDQGGYYPHGYYQDRHYRDRDEGRYERQYWGEPGQPPNFDKPYGDVRH